MDAKAIVNNALKRLTLALVALIAAAGLLIMFLNRVDANNPTFFLSSSSGCSLNGSFSGNVGETKTIYICIDGANEGSGLFGGEVSVSYNTNLVTSTATSCGKFDSCSNLSSAGSVRFLGASGPLPDGNPVTNRGVFGSVTFELKAAGAVPLNFGVARIIAERDQVQSRTGVGATLNISAPTPPPTPAPEPTPTPNPTPQPSPTPSPQPTPTPTPTPEPIPAPTPEPIPGLAKVVISPLSTAGTPGQTIDIISRADYNAGRASENITSCFTCPTAGNKTAEGKIVYKVTGPGTVYANRVTLNSNAEPGSVVRVSATYTDFKSNTSATSAIRGIRVVAPPAPDGPILIPAPAPERCVDEEGNTIPCLPSIPTPVCVDEEGTVIPCPPGERPLCQIVVDPETNITTVECPPEEEPTCPLGMICPPDEGDGGGECDPNVEDCGGTEEDPECEPGDANCPEEEEPDCEPGDEDCPEEEEPDCDPNDPDCDEERDPECEPGDANCPEEEEPDCEPGDEDCPEEEEPDCDPNDPDCRPLEACALGDPNCTPEEEPGCDPNDPNCIPDEDGGCELGDPNCPPEIGGCDPNMEDCEPGKENHKLLCHVLNPDEDEFKGYLIYLPEQEANEHLESDELEHAKDYEVSDIDNNPNNDSEDCLGIDICEYKKFHGVADEENEINQPDQCTTEEIINLTEMSLVHPVADDVCETCKIFIPTKPDNEFCAAQYEGGLDSDNDGLSDRTECILNTKANNIDSDGDSCWDGDEVNLFHTNPLVQTDCVLTEIVTGNVIITDPQNEWTVKSLDISGITPKGTLDVGITAFPASYRFLSPIFERFDELVNLVQQVFDQSDVVGLEKNKAEIRALTTELELRIETFEAFAKEQSDINFEKELSILKALKTFLKKTPDEMKAAFNQAEAMKRSLQTIKVGGTFLGLVNDFNEVGIADETTWGFNLVPRIPMEDGLYDLVAVARLESKTLTSDPVRIALNSKAQVTAPRPESLDGIQLDSNQIKQGWELTSEAKLSNVEIKTKNGRPVVSGQSNYGAQIFARWESLSLSSSIIVDSSEGSFEIQAPRDLEKNSDHKVTLYAVLETEEGKLRSDTVTIDFHVEGFNYLPWLLAGLGLILLAALAALVAKRRIKKIDAQSPEHRAKENELYHAFGEKERPTPLPENHETKQKEITSAFENK